MCTPFCKTSIAFRFHESESKYRSLKFGLQIEHRPFSTKPNSITAFRTFKVSTLGSQIEYRPYPTIANSALHRFDIRIESHSRFDFGFDFLNYFHTSDPHTLTTFYDGLVCFEGEGEFFVRLLVNYFIRQLLLRLRLTLFRLIVALEPSLLLLLNTKMYIQQLARCPCFAT